MIDNPLPNNWKDLQYGVERIFQDIGLFTEVESGLETPRGKVNVDVYAIDTESLDRIKYIVECKNWNNKIPQHVVHSFTTVMHETGANIGFIISKYGLQQGAEQYTQNTNIIGMTFIEFQQRYFEAWWKRYFCRRIFEAANKITKYVEPINSARNRAYNKLSKLDKEKFDKLSRDKAAIVMCLLMLNAHIFPPELFPSFPSSVPENWEHFRMALLTLINPEIKSQYYTLRELLEIILDFLSTAETEFNDIFNGSIF